MTDKSNWDSCGKGGDENYGCYHARVSHQRGPCDIEGCDCRSFVEPLSVTIESQPQAAMLIAPEVVAVAIAAFTPGLHKHYKGGYYVTTGLVTHHETRMPMVLYTSCTRGTYNARPLIGYPGDVDGWTDWLTDEFGNRVQRFAFVDDVPGE